MYYQNNDANFQNYIGSSWGHNTINVPSPTGKYVETQLKTSFNDCSFILKPATLRNTYSDLSELTIQSKGS